MEPIDKWKDEWKKYYVSVDLAGYVYDSWNYSIWSPIEPTEPKEPATLTLREPELKQIKL